MNNMLRRAARGKEPGRLCESVEAGVFEPELACDDIEGAVRKRRLIHPALNAA